MTPRPFKKELFLLSGGIICVVVGSICLIIGHAYKQTERIKKYEADNPIVINVVGSSYRGYVCSENSSTYVLKSTGGLVYHIQKASSVVKVTRETPSEDPR